MIIGIPKEIKNNENRVALTPAGAMELVRRAYNDVDQNGNKETTEVFCSCTNREIF